MNPKWKKPAKSRRKGAKATVTSSMAAAVKSIAEGVVSRELETKYTANQQQNIQFNSSIGSFSSEAYSCLPPVTFALQPDQAARTGYEISPTKCTLDLTIALAPVQRTCAFLVDVFILTRKANKYWPDVQALGTVPQLFLSGGPGSTRVLPYSGAISQRGLKMNTSDFTVITRRTFMLGGNVGLPNGDTTAGNSPNMSLEGMAKRFRINIPCPKTLKYSNTITPNYPDNFAPFMFIGYCKVDGIAPDFAYQSVIASWSTQIEYKDA